ncbi:iron-containing redox enzyme family protein [Sorangium sp. So ce327]|uniref:iron-containing redox enzyme family protein n=1 Tax=unclassified Sorangium TaxID=2621164 RepID=UPI003F5DE888
MQRISEQLEARRQLYSARLAEATARFWEHPQLVELYPVMLFRMHCMARATVPLMEAAVSRLSSMDTADPVVAGLQEYFTDHIPRERRHDEWILEDLAALGLDVREVLDRLPPPTIASMVGSQYYWIYHHHPIALLGYIAVVEAEPPTPERVDSIVAKTGLPRTAFRTYLRHAALEPEHNAIYKELVDRLPLEPRHIAAIGLSTLHSAYEVGRSMEQILGAGAQQG